MRKLFILALLLFTHLYCNAGITTVSTRQKGAFNSLTNPQGIGSTSYLQDDEYGFMLSNPVTWDDVFTNCDHQNKVTLRYEESARVYYGTPWTLTVQCTLKKWDETGTAISPDEYFTLGIDYDPAAGTTYNDKDVYVANDPGYRVQLIVGTITPGGSISAVPADVVLETEIEITRSYVFDQNNVPTSITNSGVLGDNTLNIRWDFLPGAESYDLEFLHVSAYDAVSVATPDWTRATRINTPNQNYTLNLAYDDGYMLYRVRGVGYDCYDKFRMEGAWSSASSPVTVNNIDEYRNWQYSAVYAEDGKRKEVLSFYDGTGKQRQAVTLNNSDNAVLVGETMYDYEGRAAVQTLPAPDDRRASQLMYYESFSLVDGTSNPYTRKVFDNDDLFNTTTCTFGITPGMDDASGASNYYSPDNDAVNTGMYQALPDAQLYPFVQTVYGPDGRPAKQSAPGADHNIGSGHEVQSYYTSPTQERIDRLFGNEVGYAEHYNQVATVDPNGQMSMSYLDLSGRVIATSLVGGAPANLDPLASNSTTSLTESFNNSNVYDPQTGTWSVNSWYMVTEPGADYNFTYTMTTEEFESICTDTAFDCVYDLEINIYDGCGNPMDDQETVHVLGTPYTIDHYTVSTFTKTFTVQFPSVGVYRIEKKLSLNQNALNAAVAAYVAMLPGDCIKSLEEIRDSLNAGIDSTECQGCDSSCIVKGLALGLSGEMLAAFIDSCQTHDCTGNEYETSNCGAMLDVFAGDLSPGGQYFDNVPAGTAGVPNDTWMTSYVWANGASSNWNAADFRDPAGNLLTNWDDVRTYWQNQWATQTFTTTITIGLQTYNSLAEFHPEYCHYGWCLSNADSREFDVELFANNTYSWANSYPSGSGNAWVYNPSGTNEEGYNMIQADPYFSTSPGSGDYSAMLVLINDYDGLGTSMWDYAGGIVGCTSCDAQWQLFRSVYLAEKAKFMRVRENGACRFLCDDTEPRDMYASGCSDPMTDGFMIRVPDLVDALATEPSSDWGNNAATVVNCNTSATTTIDFEYAPGASYGSGMVGCVAITVGAVDITCGLACLNGIYTPEQVANIVATAINSCVSTPDDYTAMINPLNPSELQLIAPAYLGASANGVDANIDFLGLGTDKFTFGSGVTGTGVDCITAQHCFCRELALYTSFYNATNDNSGNSGNYIIDHSVYTTVESYITYALNAAYGTSVTETEVSDWMTNCDESSMADPTNSGANPLLAELDCENPETPCMEDGYDITDYYAGVIYQHLVDQATQDFIQAYIDHCFGGTFGENFNVEHDDREYHFTLYYYDQAGNLTRTVPPHAIQLLDATQTADVNTYRTTGAGTAVYPDHKNSANFLVTNYKYNSFNNLTQSTTPDGNETNYYYDNIGRIVGSQNSKQAAMANHVYSYTFYDAQGRVYQVGQVSTIATISASVTATESAWETFVAGGTRTEVTSTYYDETLDPAIAAQFYGGQNYLRKRVTSVTIEQTYDGNDLTFDHATHFSYDVHGNVNELIQDYPELEDHNQQYKHLCYEYDLISGNVNMVMYQHDPNTGDGQGDQFFHKYYYDADNRLTNVYTSIDSIIWEQDEKYFYYLHGPLGRSETGDVKIQGTDYAYTIHGWIKGVNANQIDRTKDLGKDAQATNSTTYTTQAGMHSNIAQDAYGYVLGYYWDNAGRKDYKPINSAAQSLYTNSNTLTVTGDDLFNGNIKEMSTALSTPNGTATPTKLALICNHYRYDQLNRITEQTSFTGASTTSYASLTATGEYTNTFTYDAAGNISTQFRNGTTAAGQSMDDLAYHYYTSTGGTYTMTATGGAPVNGTNKLAYVDDAGTAGNYSDDLEDESAGNYTYDEIGNLISDVSEEIDQIEWNVYGKIATITRTATSTKPDLEFIYDAFGNRIVKIVKPRNGSGLEVQDEWSYTYYMRDASGNVMSTYERSYTEVGTDVVDKLQLSETHLYGASRLGIKDREWEAIYSDVTRTYSTISIGKEYIVTGVTGTTAMATPDLSTPERTLGNKTFEFSNHLGNVLVTLADRKTQVQSGSTVDYFMADVRSYSDYSAFGVQLAGRCGGTYRYDFNGKETDHETDLQDYGMRIYNARLGKFLSVDPLTTSYPELTPYQFASNTPIQADDVDGLEARLKYRASCLPKAAQAPALKKAHEAAAVKRSQEAAAAAAFRTATFYANQETEKAEADKQAQVDAKNPGGNVTLSSSMYNAEVQSGDQSNSSTSANTSQFQESILVIEDVGAKVTWVEEVLPDETACKDAVGLASNCVDAYKVGYQAGSDVATYGEIQHETWGDVILFSTDLIATAAVESEHPLGVFGGGLYFAGRTIFSDPRPGPMNPAPDPGPTPADNTKVAPACGPPALNQLPDPAYSWMQPN